jgi:hypothetical protein
MADHSADAPRASADWPAAALMSMGRAEQRFLKNVFALFRRELPERRLVALCFEPHGGFRFHFADGGEAASSSSLGPPACGRPSKPGPPHSVRRPTTSTAVRTSTSTSTVSRKERTRRRWQFRGIFCRIVRRLAFHQWKATTDALDCEAPIDAPPDVEMESTSTTDTLSKPPLTTTETTTETASLSTDTLSVASSTLTYARAASAQTSPSTGSAHCSPTLSQKRPVAASTPGSTTSPHPSPSRSANKKKKKTPPSPPKRVSGDPKNLDG